MEIKTYLVRFERVSDSNPNIVAMNMWIKATNPFIAARYAVDTVSPIGFFDENVVAIREVEHSR
jgi:hypothetical protein